MIEENHGGSYYFKDFPGDLIKIDIGDFYSDYSKINALLGWSPRVSIREGIRQTLEYYLNNYTYYF